MVIWSTLEASCPVCSRRLSLREVGGGFALGQDSDLLVRMKGKHVIQAEIHTCRHCHYSGYVEDFLRSLSDEARKRFLGEVAPALKQAGASRDIAGPGDAGAGRANAEKGQTLFPHAQYYWAYKTAVALGSPLFPQGQRLLRAYWCLRLAPASSLPAGTLKPLEKVFLRGAIQKLRQYVREDHGPREEIDPNLLYLIGELCRRNGNFLLAVSYFRRFLEAEKGARYLKQATARLLEFARARNSTGVSLEQVLYNQAPEED